MNSPRRLQNSPRRLPNRKYPSHTDKKKRISHKFNYKRRNSNRKFPRINLSARNFLRTTRSRSRKLPVRHSPVRHSPVRHSPVRHSPVRHYQNKVEPVTKHELKHKLMHKAKSNPKKMSDRLKYNRR
jgi:hypothetical protein